MRIHDVACRRFLLLFVRTVALRSILVSALPIIRQPQMAPVFFPAVEEPKTVVSENANPYDVAAALNVVHPAKVSYSEDGMLTEIELLINDKIERIQLTASSDKILSEDLMEIYLDRNRSKLTIGASSYNRCHYHANDPSNRILAAVSNCDQSLKGTVILDNNIYILHSSLNKPNVATETKDRESNSSSVDVKATMSKTNIHKRQADLNQRNGHKRKRPAKLFCGVATNSSADSATNISSSHVVRNDPIVAYDDAAVDYGEEEDNEANAYGQSPRTFSSQRELTVEIALFVDAMLFNKFAAMDGVFADSKLQDFILTAFNSIQLLFKQPSLSPLVTYKIVRYEVLKSQPDELAGYRHDDGDAETYLDLFCNYQANRPQRNWDHGFMFTGYDLHRGGSDKSISGIAKLGGICDPGAGCTLAEGLDFSSAFIGAHEMGHSFGFKHDEPYCGSSHIMSSSLGPGKLVWSTCSNNDFAEFLSSLNKTKREASVLKVPNDLPGQRYSADEQCELMHGAGYKKFQISDNIENDEGICNIMWCGQASFGRIITSHPALEGTFCAEGRICQLGKCVLAPSEAMLKAIDGGWSGWSLPAACSSCSCPPIQDSVAVLRSSRSCTNPSPRNNGRECVGAATRGIVCSLCRGTLEAQSYANSFCERKKQATMDAEISGTAKLMGKASRACKIFCEVKPKLSDRTTFRHFGDILPDGTPCGVERFCVQGECLSLTCGRSALLAEETGCPSASETCGELRVPVLLTSAWTEWSEYSSCSATCGQGEKTRSRRCAQGVCQGIAEERSECVEVECAKFLDWSDWTRCSPGCGPGKQSRQRVCYGTGFCVGWAEDERSCMSEDCSSAASAINPDVTSAAIITTVAESSASADSASPLADAQAEEKQDVSEWSPWQPWSACTKTCGPSSERQRTRICPVLGACEGIDSMTESCTVDSTCPMAFSFWENWSECSISCGREGGYQIRKRQCRTMLGEEMECAAGTISDSLERRPCSFADCDNAATTASSVPSWSGWTDWSDCYGRCGVMKRKRERQCTLSNCRGDDVDVEFCNNWPACMTNLDATLQEIHKVEKLHLAETAMNLKQTVGSA